MKNYVAPELKITTFANEDIIVTSDIVLPINPDESADQW